MEVELLAVFLTVLALILVKYYSPILLSSGSLPPGPTALPIIGHFHLLSPLLHRTFRDLSVRYGPIFSLRLGSVPCVVASSADLARDLLKTNEVSFTSRIDSVAINRITYGLASLAFAPHGPFWRFIRKLTINELLGCRSVNNLVSVRARESRRLLRLLAEKSERGEAINLTQELPKVANNIISQMVLGPQSCSAMEGRVEEARIVVREVTKVFGELNLSDFLWLCRKLDLQGFEKRIEDIYLRFDALLEEVITEREQLRKQRKDQASDQDVKAFLDVLLDNLEDNQKDDVGFTRLHIKGLIIDMFVAGTDTTAITIEWMLAELINNPKVLEKAREEIDRVIGKGRLVRESDGPNIPYIQAIVKETLRLHPAVPLVIRKCVKECRVRNHRIPKKAMVIVNSWAMGRDPEYWESPLNFQPERFLNQEGEKPGPINVRGQQFELLPFGYGQRSCAGVNLARQMLPALIAVIIQCFDFKFNGDGADHRLNMEERPGLTVPRLHDLICVPVARFSPLNMSTIIDSEII